MFNSDFTSERDDEFRVVDPSETPEAPAALFGDEAVVSIDDTFTFDVSPAPAAELPVTATDPAAATDTTPPATPASDAAVAPADDTGVALTSAPDTDTVTPAADDGFASDIPDLPLAGLGFDFAVFI